MRKDCVNVERLDFPEQAVNISQQLLGDLVGGGGGVSILGAPPGVVTTAHLNPLPPILHQPDPSILVAIFVYLVQPSDGKSGPDSFFLLLAA